MESITVKEFADAAGISLRNAQRAAARGEWRGQKLSVSAGTGRQRYMIDSACLPDLFGTTPTDYVQQVERENRLIVMQQLADNDLAKDAARREVIRAFEAYHAQHGGNINTALTAFSAAFTAGEISLSDTTKLHVKKFSRATYFNWLKLKQETGNLAGARPSGRISEVEKNPALLQFVVSLLTGSPNATAQRVLQACQARFASGMGDYVDVDTGEEKSCAVSVPSISAIRRFVDEYKKSPEWERANDPSKFKGKRLPAFGSYSEGVERLNQLWELDGTPADVACIDGRHMITGCIDVYSRDVKFIVSKTARATVVGSLIRQCLLEWGKPEAVKTDNGSDYVANYLEQVLDGLDIKHDTCLPGQPWMKPHIERLFRTLSHSEMELLPSYVGHNVGERQEIRARQIFGDKLLSRGELAQINMTGKQLQEFLDLWAEGYRRTVHGTTKQSPLMMRAAWRQPIQTVSDPRVLDMLLAPAPGSDGLRTVTKRGIKLDSNLAGNGLYIHADLGSMVGKKVFVRYDEADFGHIYVYTGDTRQFICIAEDVTRTGTSRQVIAQQARTNALKHHQGNHKKAKKLLATAKLASIAEEIIQHKIETAGNIHALPQPKKELQTAALEQAAKAQAAADSKQVKTDNDTASKVDNRLMLALQKKKAVA